MQKSRAQKVRRLPQIRKAQTSPRKQKPILKMKAPTHFLCDLMKSQMETQNESLEGSGLKAALKAEGSTLIYLFTVEDDAMAELLKSNTESIQSSLDSQASAFEAIARSLIAAVEEIENPIVVVRYVDNAGEEIFSQEFVG